MQKILDSVYKVYRDPGSSGWGYSYLITRKSGNIFLARMARGATIHDEFKAIEAAGGISRIYITDFHFAGTGVADVAEHFNAPVMCSMVEKPKLAGRGIKLLETFPFETADLEQDWRVIPTPGHTNGGVCYLWRHANHGKLLFTGDFLYYDGTAWIAGNKTLSKIRHSLDTLRALEFDILIGCGDDDLGTPYVELSHERRDKFFDALIASYNKGA